MLSKIVAATLIVLMNRINLFNANTPYCDKNSNESNCRVLPNRIVRFYELLTDNNTIDESNWYYGVLLDDQTVTVGITVSLLEYNKNNIYDTSSHKIGNIQKQIGKLLTPVEYVPNIYCIGLNYKSHAIEFQNKNQYPLYPILFSKPTTSIINPHEDIIIPNSCVKDPGEVDYEGELVIIIGKKCKNVSENDALKYIFGYSIANDVSARFWQLNKDLGGTQWIRGKSFDTFCPFGPCALMEYGDNKTNAQNLNLYTKLNGKTVQNSNTKEMIFSIKKLVSFLSQSTTLLPGTVILSGTPDGVGFARKPPLWLKNGDNVICGIQSIGELINNVKD
eukprot:106688_1